MKFKGWVKVEIMKEVEVEGDSYTDALSKTREALKSHRQGLGACTDHGFKVTGSEYGVRPNDNK